MDDLAELVSTSAAVVASVARDAPELSALVGSLQGVEVPAAGLPMLYMIADATAARRETSQALLDRWAGVADPHALAPGVLDALIDAHQQLHTFDLTLSMSLPRREAVPDPGPSIVTVEPPPTLH